MGAAVDHRPTAGEAEVFSPARSVLRWNEMHRPKAAVADGAEHARIDDLFGFPDHRTVDEIVARKDDAVSLGGFLGESRDLFHIEGNGLLDQHVLAGIEAAHRLLVVETRRREDANCLNAIIVEKRVQRRVRLAPPLRRTWF
jgi:hypothetical protein